MCIAIFKPKGAELPSIKELKCSWENNSHGAGFAIARGKYVEGHKGYLNFNHFHIDLKDKVSVDDNAIIHFRFATHGSRGGGATHPFPVSNDEEELKKLLFFTDVAVAHNGIISDYGTYGTNGLSDTQQYIKEILAIPSLRKNLLSETVGDLLELATGSKWAFLFANGDSMLVGDWNENEDTGVCYSNHGYKYMPTTTVTYMNQHHYPRAMGYEMDGYDDGYGLEREKYAKEPSHCKNCGESYYWDRESCFKCNHCVHCGNMVCTCSIDLQEGSE